MNKQNERRKKDCMFQFATKNEVIEDTGLITYAQAKKLYDKHLPKLTELWNDWESPQLCIWVECENNVDYHKMIVDIDYRDCELVNGEFYRVERKKVSL